MNDTEINNMIRRLIGEEQATYVSPELLTQAKADAINQIANLLVRSAPEYFEKKVSLAPKQTNVHHFELPTDLLSLKRIWDYDARCGDISGAVDNGSGAIRITVDSTFAALIADEDIVTIHDVAGTTEANDTWQIDYSSGTTFDLVGSTFTNAYSSGGRVFLEKEDTYKYPIKRTPSKYQTAGDETKFFHSGNIVVVDDPDFDSDLIILYRYLPSTLAEIPSYIHFGIYALGTIMCMHLPNKFSKEGDIMVPTKGAEHLRKNYDICADLWNLAKKMAMEFRPVLELNNISKVSGVNKWL